MGSIECRKSTNFWGLSNVPPRPPGHPAGPLELPAGRSAAAQALRCFVPEQGRAARRSISETSFPIWNPDDSRCF
jgi:hypothetical protein